jgi:hypothetical protein
MAGRALTMIGSKLDGEANENGVNDGIFMSSSFERSM